MTKNPGAAAPTTVRLYGVVHTYSECVGAVPVYVQSQVMLESDEAIGMRSEKLAINPDFTIRVNAVKVDEQPRSRPTLLEPERFSVDPDATRAKTSPYARWIVRT